MSADRIALCHEWITTYGGSEQVAAAIARALDIKDVFTFTADVNLATQLFPGRRIARHRFGAGRWAETHWQWLLPVMPVAWRQLDLSPYNVVITSSHACTNAIRTARGVLHISYCHTPMRYAWDWRAEIRRIPPPLRPLWPAAASILRVADRRWARNVTLFVANSRNVGARIRKHYGREAKLLYPPIDTAFWTPARQDRREDFFLFAGRLVSYKRANIAVLAAAEAGARLVVAGTGPELPRLQQLAARRVEFIPSPSNMELRDLYRQARALVFPGVEDFGMTLVEAQACGTPVVAFDRGGAREAVVHQQTGTLYDDPSPSGLARVLRSFKPDGFAIEDMRRHAKMFDVTNFERGIRRIVREATASRQVE
jgi:glycosyltransferase involved in cell wall biosynthesis